MRSPLIEALRPRQWVKNAFVLAGIVFAGRLFDHDAQRRTAVAFVLFCAASSAVYLLNDLCDRGADARHPVKRSRPLASGRLAAAPAVVTALGLGAGAVLAATWLGREELLVVAAYLTLGVAYSTWLKRISLLDAHLVAVGFVLRAVGGAVAIAVPSSPWLLFCTFLLALFLSLGKRRHELMLLGEEAAGHRRALSGYSLPLIDSWLSALAGATIVTYALYTQAPRTVEHFGTTGLLYTVPFVVYGIFRYQDLVVRQAKGADPGALLARDPALRVVLIFWAVTAVAVIYR